VSLFSSLSLPFDLVHHAATLTACEFVFFLVAAV
jgi:hypothetical protein